MAFTFQNLDSTTRKYMLQELDLDLANEKLYLSNRLMPSGTQHYPSLLREAIESHDDVWLAQHLKSFMGPDEVKRTKSGGFTLASIPNGAHETLAEGEFNRYYMRGLCARAVAEGIENVEVYRGKPVSQPRTASQEKLGQKIPSQTLLEDLRKSIGTDSALGLPSGPNSGLTVKLTTSS